MAAKRIKKEVSYVAIPPPEQTKLDRMMYANALTPQIADLSKENLGAITLTPNESNIFSWRASLPGPAGSPYEDGVFEVDIRIPEDYPSVFERSPGWHDRRRIELELM